MTKNREKMNSTINGPALFHRRTPHASFSFSSLRGHLLSTPYYFRTRREIEKVKFMKKRRQFLNNKDK